MVAADAPKSVLDSVDPSVFSARKFADSAAQIIRRMILANEVKPGERLNELSLAQQLGISRSPVREAMQSLAGEGLVHFVAGRGAFVVELDLAMITQLGQIRAALECLGTQLAAEVATDEQIRALEALLHDTEASMDAPARAYPSDLDFHRAVLELSGNPRLVEMASMVGAQLRLARLRSAQQPERAREALREHRVILAAIKQRDAGRARAAMQQHLDWALENVSSLYD